MPSKDCNHSSSQYHELLSPPSCLLLLNGFLGVGNFTIAKALEAKLKLGKKPHRLLDNHLLIDLVVAIEPERNTDHYALLRNFRRTALDGLKALQDERLVIIFTAALSTSDLPTPWDDIELFKDYVDLAEARGVPLVVINIVCDMDANRERVGGRKGMTAKTKLTDVDILEKIRRDTSLLSRELLMECGNGGNVFHFALDTSELGVEQGVQKVLGFLHEVEDEMM